jgi:hypothetical protein
MADGETGTRPGETGEPPLSGQDILTIWELGQDRHDADRALLMLTAGYPERSWEELVRLSIGARDTLLIRLRARQLGGRIPVAMQCPSCQERLEFDTSAEELLSSVPAPPPETVEFEVAGLRLRARPLDSRDLAALPAGLSRAEGRRHLVRRALLEAWSETTPISADALPAEAVTALAERLAEADPGADLEFALNCPGCRHAWVAIFDITAYFWGELTALARATLEDVHLLASAYGWAEADILEMSRARRRYYLSRINP